MIPCSLSRRSPTMAMNRLLAGNSNKNNRVGDDLLLLSTAALAVGSLAAITVACCNIRWKYLLSLHRSTAAAAAALPRKLPMTKVDATERTEEESKSASSTSSFSIVLIHGMWQTSRYFQELQEFLSEVGHASYAIDLLPGERWLPGGMGHELVQDLECTLRDIQGPYVLVGHSKGGMLIQRALQQSEGIKKQTVGVVLMGSYPLGKLPPIQLFTQKHSIVRDVAGALYLSLFGKIRNRKFAKDIFLLPSADEAANKDLSNHLDAIVQAPADGALFFPYHHYLSYSSPSQTSPQPCDIPTLIMWASHDILCPPGLLKDAFDERFTKATHVTIPHQAHSFRDDGWEISLLEPLMDWLNLQSDILDEHPEWTKQFMTIRQPPPPSSSSSQQ